MRGFQSKRECECPKYVTRCAHLGKKVVRLHLSSDAPTTLCDECGSGDEEGVYESRFVVWGPLVVVGACRSCGDASISSDWAEFPPHRKADAEAEFTSREALLREAP